MAPKGINVYSVAELETLDRADLLQFKKNIEEALSASEEKAMEQVKDMVAKFGIDPQQLALFLGVKPAATAPAANASNAAKPATSRSKSSNPELDALKQDFAGRTIIDRVTGAKYKFGTRGRVPAFVADNIAAIRNNEYDFEEEQAPGEVNPNDQRAAE